MHDLLNKTLLGAALTWAMLTAPAVATAADGGFMVGGGIYYAQLDDNLEIDWENIEIGDITFDSSSTAYNLDAGYRFNSWLAVDAGYWDLGSFKSEREGSVDREAFDATTWTVGGMVSIPLWILDVYARGGAAIWDYDGDNFGTDGTDPYYGLGVAINIGGSVDFYAEWVRFDLDTSIDNFGIGLRLTF